MRVIHEIQSKSAFLGLAWSNDGRRLATVSNWGRTYIVWTADGKQEREFEHPSDLPLYGNSIAFLGGGQLLLTPHASNVQAPGKQIFSIWNIGQGKVIRDVPGPYPQKGIQFNGAFHFAVSPDESVTAVVSSLLPKQPVTLYSTGTWTVIRQFPVTSGAASVAVSLDGKMLAIGRLDGAVDLYDLTVRDSPKKSLVAYDPRMMVPIGALAFSPDSQFLAGGAGLTTQAYNSVPSFKLWWLSDLSLRKSDLPATTPVRQISWNREGTQIAVAAGDKTVRLGSPSANPNDGWKSLPFSDPVMSLAFSPKDDVLAVASGVSTQIFTVPGQFGNGGRT